MNKRRTRKWIIGGIALTLLAAAAFQQFLPPSGAQAAEAGSQSQASGSEPEAIGSQSEASGSEPEAVESQSDAAASQPEAVGSQTNAAASQTEATGSQSQAGAGEVSMYPVTAITKMLENGTYTLYLDEKTGNVRVTSQKSGTEWLGAPIVPRSTMPNNKKFMDSAVHLKYTEGADITSTYSLKDKETAVSIAAGSDYVTVSFAFELEKLYFDVVYRLTETGLEVTIPYSSIREEGKAKLISIEPLPFMNAAAESEEGAMLLPDGSGALLHFRPNHPAYLKGYSEMIYGPDPTFITQTHDMVSIGGMRANTPRQFAALPVFGMYRDGIGTLGIVTQGDYDARINGTPAGIRNIPLYRSSAEFIYRKNDVIFIGSSGQIPYYQGQKIKGDRSLSYVLLEKEQAGYVGMAAAYRSYLINERGIEAAADSSAPLSLTLLGGIKRDEILGSTFIRMTTFDQAQAIISELKERGIKKLEVTLDGWSKNGLYGEQPDHFPAASQLGGKSGLKKLADFAAQQDTPLYLRTNYVKPFGESGGFSKRKDAVRGMDREMLKLTSYYLATRWTNGNASFYLMKPEQAYRKHIAKELDTAAAIGAKGIQFQYMGELLYSDEDSNDYTSRAETAAVWIQALEDARQKTGRAAVDYGFGYTLGAVDRIDNAPLFSSGYIFTDEAVPFFQLALHGLVPYYAEPANLREDSATQFLKAVEYGALPSYELTHAPTSKLQRTLEDRLFSSEASQWLDTAVEEYNRLKPYYEAIAGKRMTSHRQLQAGVYLTEYENGVKAVVNYSDRDVEVEGMRVGSMDFAVTGV
jgi:hypothetical protein